MFFQQFISKLEKELETLKQKNQDLLQRNINYSEDLAQKYDQELEIERLKVNFTTKFIKIMILQKLLQKEQFENNNRINGLRDSKIEDLERVLRKKDEEISFLHVFCSITSL